MGVKLTPKLRISGPNGEVYNARAILVELTDNSGYSSDSLRIMLSADNLQHNIKAGDQIRLEWGYKEDAALFDMGLFNVSNPKPLYLPTRLEVFATANALHINAPSKARRSQSYMGTTVADVVAEIAARLKLTPKVHKKLGEKFLVHLDQKNESDLSFLQRLARSYDAVAKAYDGSLIYAPRGQTKTQSGQAVPPINLIVPVSANTAPYNALRTLDVEIPEREQFLGVKADYHNQALGVIETVAVGNADFAQLPGRFKDKATATDAANAELSRIKRQSLKCRFSVPGNPEIMAEGLINISGAGDRVDGDFSCDQVVHRWDTSTFGTSGTASAVVR